MVRSISKIVEGHEEALDQCLFGRFGGVEIQVLAITHFGAPSQCTPAAAMNVLSTNAATVLNMNTTVLPPCTY